MIIENSLRGLRYRLRKKTMCQKAEPSGQLSQATHCILIQDLVPFRYGMLVCMPHFKAQSIRRHPVHERQLKSHGNCSQNKMVVFWREWPAFASKLLNAVLCVTFRGLLKAPKSFPICHWHFKHHRICCVIWSKRQNSWHNSWTCCRLVSCSGSHSMLATYRVTQ